LLFLGKDHPVKTLTCCKRRSQMEFDWNQAGVSARVLKLLEMTKVDELSVLVAGVRRPG
jgi:hypothetical protein